MAGHGPAPAADPVRRSTRSVTTLPAEGRKGAIPEWPLREDAVARARLTMYSEEMAAIEAELDECEDSKVANRLRHRLGQIVPLATEARAVLDGAASLEQEIWEDLWALPQAVVWERMKYTREVAQYARWKAKGELGNMAASTEARMLADRLGLTPRAMQDLKWVIVTDQVNEKREEEGTSARNRIAAVAS